MAETNTPQYLDFERPFAELERKIAELKAINGDEGVDVQDEVTRLQEKAAEQLSNTYGKLDAWQKTQVARHVDRPHFSDYCAALVTDFTPLAGDRRFGEDCAIVGGIGRFRGRPAVVIGHEKGTDTESRLQHNFGMARPEGYRKAVRLMDLADQFALPVLTFVDTPGAYPGLGAEERGQAEAIARSTQRCLTLRTPIVAVVTGEGGSGGAVALASANKVLILEHSVYSVISPEGCASILWRDQARAKDAAIAMKISAAELAELKVVDTVIPEPAGGAHRHRDEVVTAVGDALEASLRELSELSPEGLVAQRRQRFLDIGRTGLT